MEGLLGDCEPVERLPVNLEPKRDDQKRKIWRRFEGEFVLNARLEVLPGLLELNHLLLPLHPLVLHFGLMEADESDRHKPDKGNHHHGVNRPEPVFGVEEDE